MVKQPKYYLNAEGEFVIENYNFSKPFANFFPGIAGKYGIPMWVFYVNRAQGIASFGTKDKDHSIVEFFPANKAWQMVSSQGFRTFIKVVSGKKAVIYEPFHNGFTNLGFKLENRMRISSSGLIIEESNFTLGLNVKVEYFNIPNDSYAGLARIVTIENTGRNLKKMQILDGLPQIVPFGTSNLFLKKLGRTIEAWMNVENLDKSVPFYKLDVDPSDRPEVIHIKEGNFFLSFQQEGAKTKIIRPIVDPGTIFGQVTDFSCPQEFIKANNFLSPKKEIIKSKTPCGFSLLNLSLPGKKTKTFSTVIGYMRNLETLNSSIEKITRKGYLDKKLTESKEIIAALQQDVTTNSSSREFNLYAKQTYLDNILRGGYPVLLKPGAVFYLYSRKHGDLERDYNKFQLQPTYFSQGNGNYRDANQNRRSDIWFNPDIQDENITSFFNLIQTDGFNPLVIKGASFSLIDKEGFKKKLQNIVSPVSVAQILDFLARPFSPGEAILFLEDHKIKPSVSYDEFLAKLITYSQKLQEAEHGEGFWIDHWAYNLDLLESYLGIYPEKLKELFFISGIFTYFDNTETVKPRAEKYVLKDGLIRQLHALMPDNSKREMIRKRSENPHAVRTDYGKGKIYQTNLLNKLLCLLANKLGSLDPFGMGVEMEADKPNWYDALNGLPAIFGSSLCETLELKRLVILAKEVLEKVNPDKVNITEEVYQLLKKLDILLKDNLNNNESDREYQYWDKSHSLKEEYWLKTKMGLSGRETQIETGELQNILTNALKKLELGISKAKDKDTYCSYFIHEVTDYEPLKPPFIKPKKFIQKKVSLFLEGQMHALRIAQTPDEARALYNGTRNSGLFDKKLKMYKVTASLKNMPEEIGRCRVFPPGWLENESIWLHMEYKYLLETLKQGLYEEFYADFENVLVPFQNPQRYGRSILENSSFLVSSAFADTKLHGNGFVARLSGSTAEFLQIWLIMNAGKNPFFLDKEKLNLRFQPLLAGWLFDKKGNYSFNFLSRIMVTYHNPKRKDTFGREPAKIEKITFSDKNNKPVELTSDTIPAPYAEQIRSRQITKIDIYLK